MHALMIDLPICLGWLAIWHSQDTSSGIAHISLPLKVDARAGLHSLGSLAFTHRVSFFTDQPWVTNQFAQSSSKHDIG
jgi:hypothetical protein